VDADWESDSISRLYTEFGCTHDDERKAVRELATVRMIGQHSHMVGRLIFLPFVLVMFVFLARNWTFAYLNITPALICWWALVLAATTLSGWTMRRAATNTRDEILKRLQALHTRNQRDDAVAERIKRVIDAVDDEQRGAFGSPLADPALTSIFIPLGGTTGIYLLQQFLQHMIY